MVTRRWPKLIPYFFKVAKTNCQAKNCQNIYNKAEFQIQKPSFLLKNLKIPTTTHALKLLI
jgi:hypothetical protein